MYSVRSIYNLLFAGCRKIVSYIYKPYAVCRIMASKMEWLEKPRTVDILISLLDDKKYFSELKDVSGGASTSTIEARIRDLSKAGLVNDKKEAKFGGRRYIWLTDKGKKVAKHLQEIQKIL